MDVYIGLDVSLASTAVCVLDEKGKVATEAQVASTPEALVSFMAKLPHEIAAIGLEAGPLSHWLHKGMTDAGFEAVLMETLQADRLEGLAQSFSYRHDHKMAARSQNLGSTVGINDRPRPTPQRQQIRALSSRR